MSTGDWRSPLAMGKSLYQCSGPGVEQRRVNPHNVGKGTPQLRGQGNDSWTCLAPILAIPLHSRIQGGASGKEPACQCRRLEFDPWVRKISWKRAQQPTPVFLPGESHGQRSLAGYSPWDPEESDTTEATYQQQQQRYLKTTRQDLKLSV